MKPLHIALLVVGAGIAGALAVRMTQPIPLPLAPVPPAAQPARLMPVLKSEAPAAPVPLSVAPAPAKPSPLTATAPAPVYHETPKRAPQNNKPLVAKLKSGQWLPQPYVAPDGSPSPAVPAPAPAAASEQAALPNPPPERTPERIPEPPPAPRQVTLRTGTTIPVRLNESLSSERTMAGDTFWGSLSEPLVVDGLVIAERGARVSGRIVESQRAGRMNGTAVLTLSLATLMTSDGQRVAVSTDPWTKQGDSSRSEDVAKIGGGAALGAIIGAIAGGGKGAAIGAGIGGGAGAGTVMATRGKPAAVPSETIIPFRLASRVTITEQIAAR